MGIYDQEKLIYLILQIKIIIRKKKKLFNELNIFIYFLYLLSANWNKWVISLGYKDPYKRENVKLEA